MTPLQKGFLIAGTAEYTKQYQMKAFAPFAFFAVSFCRNSFVQFVAKNQRFIRMSTRRRVLALVTTVTEEVAIAISASTGCIHPTTASGIITTL